MDSTVYIVHCVDAEGPLYESPEVPFLQMKKIFNLDIEPSRENYNLLMNRQLDLNGLEDKVYNLIDPHKSAINGNWIELDAFLEKITSPLFRNELLDSNNHGWIYNWFCLDHVGFWGENPRRRDYGYHKIFDKYYQNAQFQQMGDMIQFHHHPVSHSGNFHECGTAFWGRDTLDSILTRRIIDRKWFPSVFRPGFHTERPDSNWFLEQWIPFDYGNQSVKGLDTDQPDLADGRFGDWRHAPKDWFPYHPDHDDYQREGNCRRWITRCLNMYARLREIEQSDVDDAFERAQNKGCALLAFTDHDFKDMSFDISRMRNMIKNSSVKYPHVRFAYSDAVSAIKKCCEIENSLPELSCSIENDNKKRLIVKSTGDVFGPQPYLAIKTVSGKYIWDNFDFQNNKVWTYTFDNDSIQYDLVEKIGVAANSSSGNTEVCVFEKYKCIWDKVVLEY